MPLSCKNVSKSYGSNKVLKAVSFELEAGKSYALLGRSGEGKTTLAKILGGLDRNFKGDLRVEPLLKVILLQQDFVVWPHLTVYKNIEVVSKSKKTHSQSDSIEGILECLGIEDLKYIKAGDLSYGQQQRVALARALFFSPDLIILDEPFAHYDPEVRRNAWNEITALFRARNVTSLWITHNPEEALSNADSILFLEAGTIVQEGTPETIYANPVSLSVAKFCGEMNLLNFEEQQQIFQFIEESDARNFNSQNRLMGLRPESLDLIENNVGGIRLSDAETLFLGRGYMYRIPILDSKRTLSVFSLRKHDTSLEYHLRILKQPWFFEK